MKRLFFSFLLSFLMVTISFAQIKSKQTILWQVSGNGLQQPSYVLGTFHILCEEDMIVKEKVIRAIDATQQLALEVNLTDPNELKDIQNLMLTEKKLSEQLSPSQVDELRKVLKNEYGRELTEVDNMSVFGLMSLMIAKTVTCSAKGFDMEVLQLAIQKGKSIVGLEHLNDQVKLLEKMYTAEEILDQLKEVNHYVENFKEMKQAFVDEDIQALYEYGTDPKFMSLEAKKQLLDQRNTNWVKQMPAMMKDKATLFAVGSAHLWGKEGVLNLLIQQGYKIKPVFN
ncbi:MAG: TraB/GumN family protein [Flavobacteriaceae bacterium]|jgi:uncharacterized protein YbaP (TraB family)|nr:TraB/GumN family protein [Flavobacteriaceae bacterium]